MNPTTLRKQFIVDAAGRQIGVILPIEEYVLVERVMRDRDDSRRSKVANEEVEEELRLIEQAARDPLFLADLQETMHDFRHVDEEWWEHSS